MTKLVLTRNPVTLFKEGLNGGVLNSLFNKNIGVNSVNDKMKNKINMSKKIKVYLRQFDNFLCVIIR